MRSIPIPARNTLRAAALLAACAGAAAILAPRTPSAAAVPKNVCPADAAASLVVPLSVDTPSIAQEMRAGGIATIRIDLSPQGRLVSEEVVESTRNWWLDHAALDAVRAARFDPERRACRSVGGSYLVEVSFPDD